MKYIFVGILGFAGLLISCIQINNKVESKRDDTTMRKAEQIKISDLKSILLRLQSRKLDFEFFGITSNGIDCIYFVPDSNLYAIEFEVVSEEQKPWFDKLKSFAQKNNFQYEITTYNNKPNYKSSVPAPVLHIETKSNLDQTAEIGQNIMTQIFGNNESTMYDVVP